MDCLRGREEQGGGEQEGEGSIVVSPLPVLSPACFLGHRSVAWWMQGGQRGPSGPFCLLGHSGKWTGCSEREEAHTSSQGPFCQPSPSDPAPGRCYG
jgi:hypothetical protein